MRTMAKVMAVGAAVALWGMTAWGTVGVTNVTVQQRYPWNGLVDIDYEVVCDDPEADVYVMPTGWDGDLNRMVPMANLSGDGVNAPVKAGKHRMTWDMGGENSDFHSSDFSVQMRAFSGGQLYLVVDMSSGAGGEWTVSGLDAVPEGGWTDEYKTTKLVMRLILPGSFVMGSPEGELGRRDNETQHGVTITRPFYMGVFEVTQNQWKLAMGSNPSQYTGDARPVEMVSYDMIRGTGAGTNWPSDSQVDAESFLGVLRMKTGITFDLPTEAQWEYACRAGTTTALNSGKNLTGTNSCPNVAEVARYSGNQKDGTGGYSQHTKVGGYLPNAWGLYDMHGNVYEWCLDWYEENYGEATVENPRGAVSGKKRSTRGRSWNYEAQWCRSAYRNVGNPERTYYDLGFRLACPVGL